MTSVAPARRLDRLMTVPRTLVHRQAISEVFVTDCQAIGENTFLVAAHLPRGHLYYNDLGVDEHDVMLLVETCRQAGIYISHVFYGVPADARFIFKDARVVVDRHETLRIALGRTQDLTLRITMTPSRGKSGDLRGAGMRLECLIDDDVVGEFEGALAFVDAQSFRKMRDIGRRRYSRSEGDPDDTEVVALQPNQVGRTSERNVVIGRSDDGQVCLVDRPTHPSMCDHQVDHVSGMILLEAMRQAAIVESGQRHHNPALFAMTFHRFVEPDGRVQVTSSRDKDTYHVTISQRGSVAATGEVSFHESE